MDVSLIISTYNRPQALCAVLSGVCAQAGVSSLQIEVIVADDGSRTDTAEVIAHHEVQKRWRVHHVWQSDEGFRAAAIRNKAILKATGEYLLFLDGDCIPRPHFVCRHLRLAEKGRFVAGNRIMLTEAATEWALTQGVTLHHFSAKDWIWMRLTGRTLRLVPLLFVPGHWWRRIGGVRNWKALSCNLGVWRSDMEKVNGFDERYHGWGHEDSDLVVRLQHAGVFRKDGRCATGVIHLWHKEYDRSRRTKNWDMLQEIMASDVTQAIKGLRCRG